MERACGCKKKEYNMHPRHVEFDDPHYQTAPRSLPVSRTSSLKKNNRLINKSNSFKYYGNYTPLEEKLPTMTPEDLNLQLRKLRLKKKMTLRTATQHDYVNFEKEWKKDSETQTIVPLVVLRRRGRSVETMV
ncbi:unnamed protein product [Bursaphelenchus xylophilus]|uniref:(pine wood nematode) hypothetical protein n=1 Tax=Bursaphelenchus xylophilus TaxID=6326 RepID=A0A1I7RNH5_BURXY|nr:unnamed protein product [Bursaphelenchus xylophilus]CAG9124021.1 unnamed protein product [Bursaphelenchus xylophilus]